jgi:hypothetical protein
MGRRGSLASRCRGLGKDAMEMLSAGTQDVAHDAFILLPTLLNVF